MPKRFQYVSVKTLERGDFVENTCTNRCTSKIFIYS